MNPELQALLVVQDDDAVIRGIEARLAALAPRLAALETAQRRAAEEAKRANDALAAELARLRDNEAELRDKRKEHERRVERLNNAQKLNEATAAAREVESSQKAIAELETQGLTLTRRVTDLRTAATANDEVLRTVTTQQADALASVAAEKTTIEAELTTARAKRAISAQGVGPALLRKYDRVHERRRTAVVVALHEDFSCGACETAIPLQRRPAMSSGTVIEPCEGCGVLLYFRPTASE